MATSNAIVAVARDPDFQARTRFFYSKAARAVLNEVWGGDPDEGVARQKLARQLVLGGFPTETLVYGVLSNPIVADAGVNALDNDLEYAATVDFSTAAKALK